MRLILSILIMFLAVPAFAQDDAARELELAKEMHQIWPVRIKVEKAIDKVSVKMPPDDQAAFKAAMRKAIKYEKLEEDSIKAMVDTFTVQELERMVAFYGSPEGRAISAKIEDYQAVITPSLVEMLDKALMDIKTGSAPGQMP